MDLRMFIEENTDLMYRTLKELCLIPAPSHMEHKRAEYCKSWLENVGAEGVYIDDALNVVYPLNCADSKELTVFVAHTDTVFPDMEPMRYLDDGEKIHCPGVGDDTASVTVLLMTVKYLVENKITPLKGMLFVCNSCEEGLGNLKGTRQIFKDYAGRIAQFVSFDGGSLQVIANNCAGSHRYEVEVLTEGGHSFGRFGNANAINELAKIITRIYDIHVPQKEGSCTTYNVGVISGGTSVNTIAQSAKMLCEYRSDDKDCLGVMQKEFQAIFGAARSEKVQVKVTQMGDRPCSDVDKEKQEALTEKIENVYQEVFGWQLERKISSTDCNIPLSMGIPAVCMSVYFGNGAHTREEWIEKISMVSGLEVAIKTVLKLTESFAPNGTTITMEADGNHRRT